MFVFKAAVVGAGTMGGEIAQTIAAAGVPVVLKDVEQRFVDQGLEKARQVTQGRLGGLVSKGKITQEQADTQLEEVMGRIVGTTEYEGFGDVDFVVEAVPERMPIKQAVFAELDAVTPGHAVLSSNTSSLSITEIGEATSRPEKVVGFHYFYPASIMRLIEIVEGDETSEETVQTARSLAMRIGKTPIVCGEVPGFVVNRILTSAISEIWRVQEAEGIDVEEIDRVVQESKAAPMGPFFLTDLLGLDTVLHVAEHLRESYGDERFFVHARMKELVEAGNLGQKTGRGFYEHGS
ncbi:MAG: 3-hydroxyacyl-CoA dehydrogenase family protein [Thermoleophilaceae bacterium]|nr:3-hydroxyacyl-CoA dehydrogenase family protein [Thermoleophilaceae bacterium]